MIVADASRVGFAGGRMRDASDTNAQKFVVPYLDITRAM